MGQAPRHVRDRPGRRSGATRWTPSPTSRPTARSRCGSTRTSNDRLIGVSLLTEEDDVLLATRNGKAIRFAATDVREFQSRTSTGVRGITPDRRRRGHLAVDPARLRGDHRGARGLSARRAVEGRRARADAVAPSAWPSSRRARGVHPHRLRQRLRQAQLGLRISPHQPRRPGHHQHRQSRAQRPGRRQLPGPSRRAADAGHRSGQADPDERRRHPRHRPQQRRRAACSTSPRTSMSSPPRGSRRARRKPKRRMTPRTHRPATTPHQAAMGKIRRNRRNALAA